MTHKQTWYADQIIILMESSAEDATLNEQHGFITASLGYHIHPTIVQALSQDAQRRPGDIRIADVSRGKQFDDGAGLLPPSLAEAQRTKVQSDGSVATEKMKHLRGHFDVVAVRLLHTTLRPDQFNEALDSLMAVLKPGGWLQWIDWDPMTARIATVKPGAPDAVLRDILYRFTDALRTQKAGSTYRISTAMSLHLEDGDSEMYTVTPEVQFTKTVVGSAIAYLERNGHCTADEASDLRAKVNDEIESADSLLFYDLWCHIARKPIASS